MSDPIDAELVQLQRRYDDLKARVGALGFIAPGTVLQIYTTCASEGCRCRRDPPQKHGPYYQYTRKLDGKTITRRLHPAQVKLYRKWIGNRRKLDELIKAMDQTSRDVEQLLRTRTAAKTHL